MRDGAALRRTEVGRFKSGQLEGGELTKFMASQLNEYLTVFDKVEKRLRNQAVTEAFAEIFAQEGKDPARRADFEQQTKLKEMQKRLKELTKAHQFREVGEIAFDEEHKLYSVSFTDSQGAVRRIDWALASAAESRQMLAKYAQLREQLVPPFYIEYAAKPAKGAEVAAEDETDEAAGEESAESAARRHSQALLRSA